MAYKTNASLRAMAARHDLKVTIRSVARTEVAKRLSRIAPKSIKRLGS